MAHPSARVTRGDGGHGVTSSQRMARQTQAGSTGVGCGSENMVRQIREAIDQIRDYEDRGVGHSEGYKRFEKSGKQVIEF